ncbi:MAG: SufE family protein [Candidatus Omnitrophica bacterium]|nr:SufE family protein [Candidatus Omnitrophota bacterium]
MDLNRLYKNFEVLENWQDRYRFIIEMGKKIPQLSETDKIEANRVHGCVSTVHMVITQTQDIPPRIHFVANSDAMIVNGLIAIMQIIYDGKTPEEITGVNIDTIFKKLGLEGHLSPNRRNGFFAMVERLRALSKK